MRFACKTPTVLEMPNEFSKFLYSFAVTLRAESPSAENSEEVHALVK